MNRIKYFLSIILLSSALFSCGEEEKQVQTKDKEALSNWAENIITPALKKYQSQLIKLDESAKAFTKGQSSESLKALQEAYVNSYKAFQKVIIFKFDYIELSYFIETANTYPTDTKSINENITLVEKGQEESVIFRNSNSLMNTYQGFPALDYLLYAPEFNLAYYQTPKGLATAKYIQLLTGALLNSANKVLSNWLSSKEAYLQNKTSDDRKYSDLTINGFIQAYEKHIRAEKVGLAAGRIANLGGKEQPDIIEAFYNRLLSKDLLYIALKSSQDFFNGKYFNADETGASLYTMLVKKGHQALADDINKQYELIYKQLDKMPADFRTLAENKDPELKKLYDLMQVNVANYKTKMLPVLNIVVAYQDTDGD